MGEDDEALAVRLPWVDLDDTPVYSVNQMIGQVDQDDIVLSFGFMNVPVIIGDTPEERREQAENIGYVAVRPVARLSMTRRRFDKIMKVLETTRANYDRLHGGEA